MDARVVIIVQLNVQWNGILTREIGTAMCSLGSMLLTQIMTLLTPLEQDNTDTHTHTEKKKLQWIELNHCNDAGAHLNLSNSHFCCINWN